MAVIVLGPCSPAVALIMQTQISRHALVIALIMPESGIGITMVHRVAVQMDGYVTFQVTNAPLMVVVMLPAVPRLVVV